MMMRAQMVANQGGSKPKVNSSRNWELTRLNPINPVTAVLDLLKVCDPQIGSLMAGQNDGPGDIKEITLYFFKELQKSELFCFHLR